MHAASRGIEINKSKERVSVAPSKICIMNQENRAERANQPYPKCHEICNVFKSSICLVSYLTTLKADQKELNEHETGITLCEAADILVRMNKDAIKNY